MNYPKFSVGEEVIVQTKNYPEFNGEYTITEVLPPNSVYRCRVTGKMVSDIANGFGYLMDEPFIAYGEVVEGSFCETALRKKHKPSDMSFEELMKSFNTLKEIA